MLLASGAGRYVPRSLISQTVYYFGKTVLFSANHFTIINAKLSDLGGHYYFKNYIILCIECARYGTTDTYNNINWNSLCT